MLFCYCFTLPNLENNLFSIQDFENVALKAVTINIMTLRKSEITGIVIFTENLFRSRMNDLLFSVIMKTE